MLFTRDNTSPRQYLTRNISKSTNNRKLWTVLNSISYQTKPTTSYCSFQLFTKICDHFSAKFSNLDSTNFHINNLINGRIDFTEFDVLIALRSKNKFSKGPDNIPWIFYQRILSPVIHHITFLFKRILEAGYITPRWSRAKLVPILKKHKNPSDFSSYHPIIITDCLLRVFEKILLKFLYHWVKNSISSSQHYALRNRSTITNLLEFTNYI